MDIVSKLLSNYSRKSKIERYAIQKLLIMYSSLDVGIETKIEENVIFKHSGIGTVIHNNVTIKKGAMIYSNVTIGRADVMNILQKNNSLFEGVVIGENAIISTGARVLCKEGTLYVGKNTVIGANAVLTKSTGDNEVWVGIPAKKVK